jgi:hypothetical protein
MPGLSTWNLDQTRLLTRRELVAVLADLAPRAARSANVHRNLVIVRLACCCGLRVSEIANLQLDDVVVDVTRPHLRLRRDLEAHGAGSGNCVMHNTICSKPPAASPIRHENAVKRFVSRRKVLGDTGAFSEGGFRDYLLLLSNYQTLRYCSASFWGFLLSRETDIDSFTAGQR